METFLKTMFPNGDIKRVFHGVNGNLLRIIVGYSDALKLLMQDDKKTVLSMFYRLQL